MAHGVVHWEIGGKDLAAMSRFYHDLFGWEPKGFDENYRLVPTGDGIGGGLMKTSEDMPPYVTVYVAVDDLEQTLSRAVSLGGKEIVPPQDVPGVGAFALFQDPEGHAIGLLRAAEEASV